MNKLMAAAKCDVCQRAETHEVGRDEDPEDYVRWLPKTWTRISTGFNKFQVDLIVCSRQCSNETYEAMNDALNAANGAFAAWLAAKQA